VLGPDISAIDAYGEQPVGDGQMTPIRRTTIDKRRLFLPQSLLQAFTEDEDMQTTPPVSMVARTPYRYAVGLMIKTEEVSEQGWPYRLLTVEMQKKGIRAVKA
jgi:hypothetical protein